MKAKALKKGDLIGIFSPSSWVEKDKVEKARIFLEKEGYRVFIHPQTLNRFHQSAGTDAEKIAALNELLADKNIKAIFAAGGGNFAMHLLDALDYKLVRKNPKILMGFSDVTTLLNAFHSKTGLVTFHGPVLTWLPEQSRPLYEFNMKVLAGKTPPYPMQAARILRRGSATGKLVGGNLSLFHLLPGTATPPKTKGAILFLEDVNEELNQIDRMFGHLKRMGVLDHISGLVCGAFTDLKDTGKKPFGFTLDDIVLRHIGERDIPIIMDAPFGHTDILHIFPIGVPAQLTAGRKNIRLKLREPAVNL